MNFSRDELRRLMLPLAAAIGMLAAGALAIWAADGSLRAARTTLAGAQQERKQNAERLARIAEEEREVKAKLDVYQQLKSLNVLGEERRLEWADAIARIRAQRELLDLRYRVERQRLLRSAAGKPQSSMHSRLTSLALTPALCIRQPSASATQRRRSAS